MQTNDLEKNTEKSAKVLEMQARFADRLRELRNAKNISARELSLALGQNVNYINLIENQKRFPSLTAFFEICEYFGLTASDFFCEKHDIPTNEILAAFGNLSKEQARLAIEFFHTLG